MQGVCLIVGLIEYELHEKEMIIQQKDYEIRAIQMDKLLNKSMAPPSHMHSPSKESSQSVESTPIKK